MTSQCQYPDFRKQRSGKSYLLKLLLTNLRESGMHICALDPEMEYEDLTNNLGGCFIDLMSGDYIINPLEPKTWTMQEARRIWMHLRLFASDPDCPSTSAS